MHCSFIRYGIDAGVFKVDDCCDYCFIFCALLVLVACDWLFGVYVSLCGIWCRLG